MVTKPYYFTTHPTGEGKDVFISGLNGKIDLIDQIIKEVRAKSKEIRSAFFLGDNAGSVHLDSLKLLYNKIITYTKRFIEQNPQASEDELLSIQTGNGETIYNDCLELQNYLLRLSKSIRLILPKNYILELIGYNHFGHFAGNLPGSVRIAIEDDLERNAMRTFNGMRTLSQYHIQVHVLEGDSDISNPLDFRRGKICEPNPVSQRNFSFREIMLRNTEPLDNFHYYTQPEIIYTDDRVFIIWPFNAAINETKIPEFDPGERQVILVSHTQIELEPITGNTPTNQEDQSIEKNMSTVALNTKPHIIIHGHLVANSLIVDNVDGYVFNNSALVHYLPPQTVFYI